MLGHKPDIEAEITFLTPEKAEDKARCSPDTVASPIIGGEDHDAIQEYLSAWRWRIDRSFLRSSLFLICV